MFAMIALGIGEFIGCLICGYVMDKKGQKVGVMYVMFITIVAFTFLFVVNEVNNFSPLTFAMTFTWGL
jgi:predicted MFS family arabinose efflux permease